MVELLIIAIAFAGFNVLIWFCGRLPRWGEWAAAGLIALFIPAASFFLFVLTGGRAAISETLPAMLLVACALAAVWLVVKKKTSWLVKRVEPIRSSDTDPVTRAAARASVEPPANRAALTPSPAARDTSAFGTGQRQDLRLVPPH